MKGKVLYTTVYMNLVYGSVINKKRNRILQVGTEKQKYKGLARPLSKIDFCLFFVVFCSAQFRCLMIDFESAELLVKQETAIEAV